MEEPKGLRITTWNVNGIRNPFSYPPWNRERKYAAMFDILEADIVVVQELKIQRKDLRDDMVLIPGWDVYMSVPKYQKGYSGVAIYTRNAVCAPIRAEEGITGILTPPNSTTSFRDLPEYQQIGGYPNVSQLSDFSLDAATLDSEGRCVILEFPAMVLIGVYCPANRDENRDEFRLGFLNALDSRIRNLISMGKKVFLTGDLNIIREELDTANAQEQLKKHGMTGEEYVSTPARRMLNQLLVGGKVLGERDEEKESAVMWDICRAFHPKRKGMFTCWDTKTNARPGNFGSRIDYVLCSLECYDWFSDSNIQEGLIGSDHCPVYAVFKDRVGEHGTEVHIRDIFSNGMFKNGVRQREWTAKDLLPTSAKLIPEFDRRRSIKDMFAKKPSLLKAGSSFMDGANPGETADGEVVSTSIRETSPDKKLLEKAASPSSTATPAPATEPKTPSTLSPAKGSPSMQNNKRPNESGSSVAPIQKRTKSGGSSKPTAQGKHQLGKGQSSLMGFFKPKVQVQAIPKDQDEDSASLNTELNTETETGTPDVDTCESTVNACTPAPEDVGGASAESAEDFTLETPFNLAGQQDVIDPVAAKASWDQLGLGKRTAPLCEHNEPCKSMDTKKRGLNCGRSFYMCQRPLGPSGKKERNSQWRCGTFIWSSDWKNDSS